MLTAEIRGFTRKSHIYKTLLDVPTAPLASKPHSCGATLTTECQQGCEKRGEEEGWKVVTDETREDDLKGGRQAGREIMNVFKAKELSYQMI